MSIGKLKSQVSVYQSSYTHLEALKAWVSIKLGSITML